MDLYDRNRWNPRADVYRCATGWLVKLELAGVNEQDLSVVAQGDILVIGIFPESRKINRD
jgi:HSP20 family molecular chaperone IbpA